MKNILMLVIITALFGCNKEQEENIQQPGIRFQLNGKHILFYDVEISAVPFCGEMLYSFSGLNGSDFFLISIITDTLRAKEYITGCNYWYKDGGITSSKLHVNITQNGASFYEDSLGIKNGIINKINH